MSGCVKEEKTTGFWQEMQAVTPINTGKQRNGLQVYEYRCRGCHGKNTQGAPMPGDYYEWKLRYQKGIDVLMEHTIKGFNRGLMPSRGGCKDCSETELKNAVLYFLKTSGIEINAKDE